MDWNQRLQAMRQAVAQAKTELEAAKLTEKARQSTVQPEGSKIEKSCHHNSRESVDEEGNVQIYETMVQEVDTDATTGE